MGYFYWVGILLVCDLDFGLIFGCLHVEEVGIWVFFMRIMLVISNNDIDFGMICFGRRLLWILW